MIFAGFSAEAIADRNNDAKAKVQITADYGWRRGQELPLKKNVDEALEKSPTVKKCIVLQAHRQSGRTCKPGRDIWWHELMAEASADCPAEPLDSETPLFILYTSGSTGKPKGIKHTTAGYNLFVKKTFEWVFDHRDEDVFWCTADFGWVTGHSYVVYGPLAAGATVLMYEGAPNLPDEGRFWETHRKVQGHAFSTRRPRRFARSSSGATTGSTSTICRACGCWARSARASIPKPGCGTTARSAASAARSSTPGGRPKPAAS